MLGPQGIKLSLNYHPDAGIDVCQKHYKQMAGITGVDPASNETIADIDAAMNSYNRTYVDAYFKYMYGGRSRCLYVYYIIYYI